jgi:hypothetical protein
MPKISKHPLQYRSKLRRSCWTRRKMMTMTTMRAKSMKQQINSRGSMHRKTKTMLKSLLLWRKRMKRNTASTPRSKTPKSSLWCKKSLRKATQPSEGIAFRTKLARQVIVVLPVLLAILVHVVRRREMVSALQRVVMCASRRAAVVAVVAVVAAKVVAKAGRAAADALAALPDEIAFHTNSARAAIAVRLALLAILVHMARRREMVCALQRAGMCASSGANSV